MNAISYEIASGLYLVQQPVASKAPAKPVEQATNHILVIDCSGSMMGELPQIRRHLKAKLPKLLKDDDTVTIIWFSGRGEFGVLVEAEKVAGLTDLQTLNNVIDRWLKPVGLTGFKEPLAEVSKVISRTKNGNPSSLFFMSDGCDNQWNRADILKTVEQAAGGLSAATFVEYGYYADRALLAAMAEKAGGVHIFADSFPKFEPVIDAALSKRATGGKRIEVKIGGDPIGGFAFMLHGIDELHTFETIGGKVAVPDGTASIWYLSPSKIGDGDALSRYVRRGGGADARNTADTSPPLDAAYAALSLFATRMKPDVIFPLLKVLGDVRFIKMFSTCFGKQAYSAFMQAAQRAAFDTTGTRFVEGYNPNLVPPDDAFTVLDFLQLIAEDDNARVLLDHSAFEYNRIGRGRLDADEFLTVDEQEKLEALQGEQKATRNAKKLKEIQTEIDALLAKKRTALKFEPTPMPNGYEVSALTFNESKPNVSILVCKEGTIDLAERLNGTNDGKLAPIPLRFPTKIFRNYAIIKDGLVNVGKLPVKLSAETATTLYRAGVNMTGLSGEWPMTIGRGEGVELSAGSYIVDLASLPVLNRKQVAAAQSAKALIELQYRLTEAKAAQKVYNNVQAAEAPVERSSTAIAKYGQHAADWLAEQGITDGGFSPKSTQAESTDFYMAREMEVKLKGLASLPKVDDVRAKLKGKTPPTGGMALMAPFVREVDDFMAKNPAKLHKDFIQGKAKSQRAVARGLMFQKARIVFSTIVGQVWFTDLPTLDDTTLTINVDGKDVTGTIVMSEVEVKI